MVGMDAKFHYWGRKTRRRFGGLAGACACAIWILLASPFLLSAQDTASEEAANPPPNATVSEEPEQDLSQMQAAAWRMRLTLPVTEKTCKQVKRFAVPALDLAAKNGQRPRAHLRVPRAARPERVRTWQRVRSQL